MPVRCFQGRPPMVDERTQAKKDSLKEVDAALKETPAMPPYPYGLQSWGNAYQPHPMSGKALLGGAKIQSGNKISSGRNKGKTRRKWFPYITAVKLRSEALDKELTLLVTRSCIRTINKCGGLDQYLMGEKPARLKELGTFGWKLRWLVLNSEPLRAQFNNQMEKTAASQADSFEKALANPSIREQLLKSQSEAWQKLKDKEARFERMVKRSWEGKDKHEYEFKENSALKRVDPQSFFALDDMQKYLDVKIRP